jgi:hypothetical protein
MLPERAKRTDSTDSTGCAIRFNGYAKFVASTTRAAGFQPATWGGLEAGPIIFWNAAPYVQLSRPTVSYTLPVREATTDCPLGQIG